MSWEEAKEDCELYLWGNGSLISIETEEEFKRHKDALAVYGDGKQLINLSKCNF